MADKSRLENFAELVTGSLKDDTELRLDVKEEIKSHLQEKAEAFSTAGKSPEESAELAIKSFGPANAISEDLLNANRKKMKLRNAVKLFFRFAIIPASVIVAIGLSFAPRLSISDIAEGMFSSGESSNSRIFFRLLKNHSSKVYKTLRNSGISNHQIKFIMART